MSLDFYINNNTAMEVVPLSHNHFTELIKTNGYASSSFLKTSLDNYFEDVIFDHRELSTLNASIIIIYTTKGNSFGLNLFLRKLLFLIRKAKDSKQSIIAFAD